MHASTGSSSQCRRTASESKPRASVPSTSRKMSTVSSARYSLLTNTTPVRDCQRNDPHAGGDRLPSRRDHEPDLARRWSRCELSAPLRHQGRSLGPPARPACRGGPRRARAHYPAGPVYPGSIDGKPLAGVPKFWLKIVAGSPLASITPHVLRHSLASMANDLGFTEATIAGLLGHVQGTVTGRYIHAVDFGTDHGGRHSSGLH